MLYSDAVSLDSHRVRLVLAEKSVTADVVWIDPDAPLPELVEASAQSTVPVLVDRDLTLYDARVIIDYLDERYPHPPFMPIDPVSRARTRLALYRIESDWYAFLPALEAGGEQAVTAGNQLAESLTAASDVFAAMPYFLSEEFSMLDATLAPLLWRLGHYGIVLPPAAASVSDYAKRVFARTGFQASLSDVERELG